MKGSFNSLINSELPVLIDFHAEWCQPCKIQSPIIKEVAKELSGKIRVIKIDVDKNPQLAAKYHIQGVPTLALFKEGELVWRQSGVQSKPRIIDVIYSNI